MQVQEMAKAAVASEFIVQVSEDVAIKDEGHCWSVCRHIGKQWHAVKWFLDRDGIIHSMNLDVLKHHCEHRCNVTWQCKRDCGKFCESFDQKALQLLRMLPKRYPAKRG